MSLNVLMRRTLWETLFLVAMFVTTFTVEPGPATKVIRRLAATLCTQEEIYFLARTDCTRKATNVESESISSLFATKSTSAFDPADHWGLSASSGSTFVAR